VLKQRDNIILGLALKIDSAFRALLDDARVHRVEAAIAIPFVTKLCFRMSVNSSGRAARLYY
jgi:hypothetical protein